MQSIVVPVVIGSNSNFAFASPFSLSIINRIELDRRISEVVRKRFSRGFLNEQNCINSRTLFETNCRELLCFPVKKDKTLPIREMQFSDLALFNMGSPWGIVVCFFSQYKSRISSIKESEAYFPPKEVMGSVKIFLPGLAVSLFFCEAGRITTSSSGQAILHGLELIFLQNKQYRMRALCCKKILYQALPGRPLQDTEEGARSHLNNMHSFIKVRCCCKSPGFSFFIKIPFLTQTELRTEIKNLRFGTPEAARTPHVEMKIENYNLFPLKKYCHHLISFARNMGLHLPFDGVLGGRLVCSYEENTLAFQLIFIPDFLIQREKIGVYCQRSYDTWSTIGCQFSRATVKLNRVSIYSHRRVKILPGSGPEKYISGAGIKLVSTPQGGCWGVLVSRAEASSSPDARLREGENNPAPETPVDIYHPDYRLPLPFPSQAAASDFTLPERSGRPVHRGSSFSGPFDNDFYHRGLTLPPYHQAASTVSVPPDRQGKHTQQKGRICPDAQGGPKSFDFGLYPPPGTTDPFLSEGQEQHAQQGGRSRPDMPYFPPLASSAPEALQRRVIRPLPVQAQSESTVFVPLEGQSQHTGPWDRRGFLPGPFGVRHHPYAQNGPEPSGFGLYAYGFPSPPPGATGPFLSEGQEQLAQQGGRSRPDMPYFPPLASSAPETLQRRVIRPLPVQAQSESTVSVPLEGQSQHTGPWDRSGFLSRPSGVRHHPYAQGGSEFSGFGLDLYSFSSPPQGATGPFLSEGQEQQAQQGGRSRPNMTFFPPLASVIIDPFAPKAPQQGIESSSRQSVIVSVGSVQQRPLWKPDEKKAAASQQAQKEKFDEDIDVEN